MISFFVSGKYEDRHHIKRIQAKLRELGHEIAYDWTDHEYADEGYPEEYAEADLNGVEDCDIYVGRFVADYNYKGAFVELGAAIMTGKVCCVIGHAIDDCIFVWQHQVLRFNNEEDFYEFVRVYTEK